MIKLKSVCTIAFALAYATGGCSDSDESANSSAGASSAGRAGATGVSGGGGSAQAGGTSVAGTSSEAGQGGSSAEAGAAGSAGSENAGSGGEGDVGGGLGIGDCLPDGSALQITASGNSAYVITGLPEKWSDGDGDHNVDLALCRSYTYTFTLNAAGHPFYIKLDRSLGVADAYNTGVTNNGAATGTISWTLAGTTPGALYYQCSLHQPMGGTITVVEPP